MKFKTPDQIKREARERLSRYEGGSDDYESNYEGGQSSNYIGDTDDMLDFCGQGKSFLNTQGGSDVNFTFTLQNATSGSLVIALTPTYLGTAAALATASGETVSHLLTDGTIATNVTGTAGNAKLTIAGWQNFIRNNPSQLVRMTLVSNTEATFETNIVYQHMSPYRALQNNRIPLTKYVNPDQFNTKKAIIPFAQDYPDFAFNDQLMMLVTIGGTNSVATTGEILKFTLEFGAILNPAAALAKKAVRGYRTVSRLGYGR